MKNWMQEKGILCLLILWWSLFPCHGLGADSDAKLPTIRIKKQTNQLEVIQPEESHPQPIQEKFDESDLPSLEEFPELKELEAPAIDGEIETGEEAPLLKDEIKEEVEAKESGSEIPGENLSGELPEELPEELPVEIPATVVAEEDMELPGIEPAEKPSEPAEKLSESAVQAETPLSAVPERKIAVETASFNGITPAKTTREELVRILGEPKRETKDGGDGVEVLEFSVEGFRGVAAHLLEEVVYALIVELQEPQDARKLAQSLQIQHIQSVFLTAEQGRIIGEIFPEIGVSFAYNPKDALATVEEFSTNPDIPTNVVQVIFQMVSPEAFLLRAQTFRETDPEQSRADLAEALKLDPTNAEALRLRKEWGIASEKWEPESSPEQESMAETEKQDEISLPEVSESLILEEKTESQEELVVTAPETNARPVRPLEKPQRPSLEEEKTLSASRAGYSWEDDAVARIERLARSGKTAEAMAAVKQLREKGAENPFVAIRADLLEGDIGMISSQPDVDRAYECHTSAVFAADTILNEGKTPEGRPIPLSTPEKRRLEELRIDAGLGAAADLATGKDLNKATLVEKWVASVTRAVDLLVQELGEETEAARILRYRTTLRSLAIYVRTGKELNPQTEADALIKACYAMLQHARTRKEYHTTCYETALSLDDAAKICIVRDEEELARKYLQRGIKMMSYVRETSAMPATKNTLLLGQLYYRMGQIHAWKATLTKEPQMRKKCHQEAIVWYEKAIPFIVEVFQSKTVPFLPAISRMTRGMSASYWAMGDSKRTVALLKTTIASLERYVAKYPENRRKLILPYDQLIRVLETLGKTDEAEKFREKRATFATSSGE
ncbi:MAG: hypothetical protein Q4D62_09815 [Planctomycetia bacterium]|nr:hypothetical protein [Planctomycetia bacterium]